MPGYHRGPVRNRSYWQKPFFFGTNESEKYKDHQPMYAQSVDIREREEETFKIKDAPVTVKTNVWKHFGFHV